MKKKHIRSVVTSTVIVSFVFAITYNGILYKREKQDLVANNEVVKGVVLERKTYMQRGNMETVLKVLYSAEGKSFKRAFNGSNTALYENDTCLIKYQVSNPKNSELVKKE